MTAEQPKKTRAEICTQIQTNSRQLLLSTKFAQTCEATASRKELDFVASLLEDELQVRRDNKRNKLIKQAGFPALKTFDGYSPEQIEFPTDLSFDDLQTLDFVSNNMNLVLYGPVGTGKSHLAIATGMKACEEGLKTKFFTVAQLVRRLAENDEKGHLERFLTELRTARLLILDEWGYVPVDRRGAELLFQVISESYETKSLIVTTNLPFSRWGSVLTDEQMAAAMIDRLVHHGHMLIFSGQSYRMRNALMRQKCES